MFPINNLIIYLNTPHIRMSLGTWCQEPMWRYRRICLLTTISNIIIKARLREGIKRKQNIPNYKTISLQNLKPRPIRINRAGTSSRRLLLKDMNTNKEKQKKEWALVRNQIKVPQTYDDRFNTKHTSRPVY